MVEAWWMEMEAEGFCLVPQAENRESEVGLTCGF